MALAKVHRTHQCDKLVRKSSAQGRVLGESLRTDRKTRSPPSRPSRHKFDADFYGVEMRLLVMGFIREMKDYPDVEALIEDIEVDCNVARQSLDREAWALRETGNGTFDGSWLVRETAQAE